MPTTDSEQVGLEKHSYEVSQFSRLPIPPENGPDSTASLIAARKPLQTGITKQVMPLRLNQ
jgi:hypothetical protein